MRLMPPVCLPVLGRILVPALACLASSLVGIAAPADTARHWSFLPITRPVVPPGSATHPIDRFLEASLKEAGLPVAAAAPASTWVRRVHFDLTGLPPSPDVIASTPAQLDEATRARMVDGLLASPAYGERWARHWLDIVRFGESQGFEYDIIRDNAWRYRDYVVRALNAVRLRGWLRFTGPRLPPEVPAMASKV